MDITKLDFTKATETSYNVDKSLLAEADKRGFLHGHTKYNDLFSELFFSGGKLNFKENLDKEFVNNVLPYFKSLIGSFGPKHEHKEAVCALILSELVDV